MTSCTPVKTTCPYCGVGCGVEATRLPDGAIRIAGAAIVANGGTISHQHGVGTDHAPWLAAEKGELGIAAMRALLRQMDPQGMMNPGKLLPDAGGAA